MCIPLSVDIQELKKKVRIARVFATEIIKDVMIIKTG
jgi:hypothetical protein